VEFGAFGQKWQKCPTVCNPLFGPDEIKILAKKKDFGNVISHLQSLLFLFFISYHLSQ
jgi:hypothetical protein